MHRPTSVSSIFALVLGGLALAACGDDTEGSGGAGGTLIGGGGDDGGASTATTGGPASTSGSQASSSSGEPGTGGGGSGGETGSGGAPGTGGGGSGGNVDFCEDLVVNAVDVDDVCDLADVDTSADGTAPCADLEETWPARFFRIEVEAGDCLYMRADNAGSQGADLFGGIIDPDGNDIFPDDEIACTDGADCPEGALTVAAAGTAYVLVGAYAGEDVCLAGTDAPFQLAVAVNGTAVDLSEAESCEGDLLVIIQ